MQLGDIKNKDMAPSLSGPRKSAVDPLYYERLDAPLAKIIRDHDETEISPIPRFNDNFVSMGSRGAEIVDAFDLGAITRDDVTSDIGTAMASVRGLDKSERQKSKQ